MAEESVTTLIKGFNREFIKENDKSTEDIIRGINESKHNAVFMSTGIGSKHISGYIDQRLISVFPKYLINFLSIGLDDSKLERLNYFVNKLSILVRYLDDNVKDELELLYVNQHNIDAYKESTDKLKKISSVIDKNKSDDNSYDEILQEKIIKILDRLYNSKPYSNDKKKLILNEVNELDTLISSEDKFFTEQSEEIVARIRDLLLNELPSEERGLNLQSAIESRLVDINVIYREIITLGTLETENKLLLLLSDTILYKNTKQFRNHDINVLIINLLTRFFNSVDVMITPYIPVREVVQIDDLDKLLYIQRTSGIDEDLGDAKIIVNFWYRLKESLFDMVKKNATKLIMCNNISRETIQKFPLWIVDLHDRIIYDDDIKNKSRLFTKLMYEKSLYLVIDNCDLLKLLHDDYTGRDIDMEFRRMGIIKDSTELDNETLYQHVYEDSLINTKCDTVVTPPEPTPPEPTPPVSTPSDPTVPSTIPESVEVGEKESSRSPGFPIIGEGGDGKPIPPVQVMPILGKGKDGPKLGGSRKDKKSNIKRSSKTSSKKKKISLNYGDTNLV